MPPNAMEPADVSVVIPAYRAGGTIARALASVAAQTVKPREAIVIDDGSDDGTAEKAAAMEAAMNGVELKVVIQGNAGPGAARNRGLAEAKGAYVAFLDADDEWLPEKIERSMAVIAKNAPVLVGHDFLRIEADGTERRVDCARRYRAARDPFTGLYRQGFIGTSTVVARRDALLDAGGFDETLPTAQDFALWLTLLSRPGASFYIFPEALTRYHITAGSISSYAKRRLECTLRIATQFKGAGIGIFSFWYRILAVHYEAVNAYLARSRYLAALGAALGAPVALIKLTLLDGETTRNRPLIPVTLWLWVIGAALAYLYQFRGFIEPIATALGSA